MQRICCCCCFFSILNTNSSIKKLSHCLSKIKQYILTPVSSSFTSGLPRQAVVFHMEPLFCVFFGKLYLLESVPLVDYSDGEMLLQSFFCVVLSSASCAFPWECFDVLDLIPSSFAKSNDILHIFFFSVFRFRHL